MYEVPVWIGTMSRRAPNPAQERAQKNQQTLKNLLKLEPNKICADCKTHKHPRWASWNLGIFVCIRCSGIHRGMGTHISRVKSVDLDSWTDEQLQSMLNWGNARANKYWEAKLTTRHVPSDSKVESFIRTKYELKRWVMDGPIPDPSTLDDGDDIPLSLVKEKQTIEHKESIRKASIGQSSKPGPASTPVADLIGGDPIPQRASTTSPPAPRISNKAAAAPPKTTNTKDSLLGLDFFGEQAAAPARPASTTGTQNAGGSSRPDLKQSILSLYATAPRPQAQPVLQQPVAQQFGGMSPAPQQPAGAWSMPLVASASAILLHSRRLLRQLTLCVIRLPSLASKPLAAAPPSNAFGGLGGGGFFSAKPAQPPAQTQPKSPGIASPAAAAPAPAAPAPTQTSSSAAPAAAAASAATVGLGSNSWATNDVWGDNAWGSTEPAASAAKPAAPPAATTTTTNDFGWGSSSMTASGSSPAPSPARVAADEEFGGWSSGPSASATTTPAASKPSGGFGGGSDDLFSNVWQ
ncbi:unnamed protein product [Parascedosporium putredinis]|uniref:Arf-GAP domain-containing protein n=1 Tax=Parascedosporium putredinis TaxID=1442378 RepID=A0A9P1HCC0_9PEZI|nr:unnamed protein product [Parascedosporium putredinis]CAI8004622.1 unnamed protein product [Parascedosporium putredinis]